MNRFAHAVDKSTGEVVAEFFGPPNSRSDGDSLSESLYAISEVLIRGAFPEKRGGLFGGDFGYAVDYENETFLLHRDHQDAECSCGRDEEYKQFEARAGQHLHTCSQVIISRKLESWPETPHVDLSTRWKLEDRLSDRVATKLGVQRRWDCTCGVLEVTKSWRETHHHDPKCMLELPNFRHKASGFEVNWYKYIGREMKASTVLSSEEFRQVFDDCWKSIPLDIRAKADTEAREEEDRARLVTDEQRHAMDSALFAMWESETPCRTCSKSGGMVGGSIHSGPYGAVAFTTHDEHGCCVNCGQITSELQTRILLETEKRNNRCMFRERTTIGQKLPA
jgi:hypothetical protein